MPRKGQTWSMDFVFSAFIFLVVLVALLFAWSYVNSESSIHTELKKMESKVMDISDALIRTPGLPQDWSAADVRIIGLAEEEGLLNSTKVLSLVSMEEAAARSKMGAGLYYYYFRLRDSSNQTIRIQGTDAEAGTYPGNATIVLASERYVVVEGAPAVMEFLLWTF